MSIKHAAPTTFDTWADRHAAASRLLDEAAGWGEGVDQADSEGVLRWAREYLPRIMALSDVRLAVPGEVRVVSR